MSSRRLIIGLGSGRCGTVSLKELLAAQDRTVALHEHRVLPWVANLNELYQCVEVLGDLDSPVVAGVASYYLPYLDNIRRSLSHFGFHELRVIALQRGLPETVESFMRKTQGRNHWQPSSPEYRQDPKWDRAFPKYSSGLSKHEAIGKYWEDYYTACERERVEIFPLEALNSPEGQAEILSACGFDEPRIKLDIRANAGM